MLLKTLEQHKDNLFESNFEDLGHVFVPWAIWASYFLRDQIFQFNSLRNFQADILCDKEAVLLNDLWVDEIHFQESGNALLYFNGVNSLFIF